MTAQQHDHPANVHPGADAHRDDLDDLDGEHDAAGPAVELLACQYGMTGYCSQLRKHRLCYFSTAVGKAAVLAGTYGRTDGHQWVCTCPCHEPQNYPPCPHPDHDGHHHRQVAEVDHQIQLGLF